MDASIEAELLLLATELHADWTTLRHEGYCVAPEPVEGKKELWLIALRDGECIADVLEELTMELNNE